MRWRRRCKGLRGSCQVLNTQLRAGVGDGDHAVGGLVWHAGADVHPLFALDALQDQLADAQHLHQRRQGAGDLRGCAVARGHDVGRVALGVVAAGDTANFRVDRAAAVAAGDDDRRAQRAADALQHLGGTHQAGHELWRWSVIQAKSVGSGAGREFGQREMLRELHGLPLFDSGADDEDRKAHHDANVLQRGGLHARQLDMAVGDPTSVDTTRNQDAAVFAIVNPGSVSSMQRDAYDTPTLVGDLVPGLQVEKAGRTSGFTKGTVLTEIVGPFGVGYKIDEYRFSGTIYFEPTFLVSGLGDRFSESGDSGSLVTNVDANGIRSAVGIIVAGLQDSRAPGGSLSVVMPIRPILDQMAMSLVSGHNVRHGHRPCSPAVASCY